MKTKFSGILTLLLAFVVQLTFAQEKTISGTVSDESGLPLPGATVIVQGTSNGASTDFDGNYSITANAGDVLNFSYVGYANQSITVGTSNTINTTMQPDNTLDEVVVTAFGIKRNPDDLGYAVSKVETEELTENSEPDLVRSLAGKVAGVDVNFSTGIAGSSNRIQIRGANSLSGGQPLIIVDGIAFDNSQVTTSSQTLGGGGYGSGISSIDPNNIESMTVLKSAAAAALYGSRASGGVIVITTKSGSLKSGESANRKLDVTVNSGLYFEEIANLPEYQNKYGNGVNYGYVNANGSWGPAFDTLATIPTWPNLLNAFPGQFAATRPYVAQPDNVKDLFRTGVVQDNSVSASYSDDNGSFSVTLSDLAQEGYVPFNTFDRTNFSAGGTFKLSNKLTAGGNLSYSNTDQVGGFLGNNQFAGSASSFARALWLGRTWDLTLPYTHPITGASVVPNGGWDHPLWSWENDQILTGTDRIVTGFNLAYNINDNISASFRIGYNKFDLKRRQIRHAQSRASGANGGTLQLDSFVNEDIESTLLVNFDYDLTEDIGLNVITGLNTLQNTQKRDASIGTTFIVPDIYNMINTLTQASQLDSYARSRNVGVFADVTLSYKDFLFLNGTGRNDWSSTLPLDNRSYFYPSASMSLIFTKAFNIENDVLTFGKIRGGYASVGSDASAEFLNETFAIRTPFNGLATVGNRTLQIEGLGDPAITPTFTDEIEFGADLEFFNRRIAIDFSWYKKTTTDLIAGVSVPSSSGFQTLNTNIGEMQNTGVEIGLTLVPIETENFKWTSFTTFTTNENEVTELVEGVERIQLAPNQIAFAQVGQPFGVFYGTRFARDANGNFLINAAGGGIIQDLSNGIVGDPNPDFKIGFINTFKYKNFTLRSQIDWREGGDVRSISVTSLLGRGVTRDTEDRERTFVIPGFLATGAGVPLLDGAGNQIPNTTQIDMNELYFSPAGGNTFGINTVDEGNIFDATVYRLRELSLSYDLPSKFLEKTPFGKMSFSVVGNNLWYFAPNVPKYTNFDPEVTSFGSGAVQGIEITTAPTAKRYGFKVNLTF